VLRNYQHFVRIIHNTFLSFDELLIFPAPALAHISDDYADVRFNSTIFGGSPYTGMPSSEKDERWYALIHGKQKSRFVTL
jgi:hypothetical protein